ncbi:hypothetical protein T484DRAFT_1762251, partial [Baffinella frigidus]
MKTPTKTALPSSEEPAKPRWSFDAPSKSPAQRSQLQRAAARHTPGSNDERHQAFLDDSLDRLLSPMRTHTSLTKRPQSAGSTPHRAHPASVHHARTSHSPTRSRARTEILSSVEVPRYGRDVSQRILSGEHQRQASIRQEAAYGTEAAHREWARWQREHPVLRNVPMPEWRPDEDDQKRKDWSRLQHVMKHRIIDLEDKLQHLKTKAHNHERERHAESEARARAESALVKTNAAVSKERGGASGRIKQLEKEHDVLVDEVDQLRKKLKWALSR